MAGDAASVPGRTEASGDSLGIFSGATETNSADGAASWAMAGDTVSVPGTTETTLASLGKIDVSALPFGVTALTGAGAFVRARSRAPSLNSITCPSLISQCRSEAIASFLFSAASGSPTSLGGNFSSNRFRLTPGFSLTVVRIAAIDEETEELSC